MSKNEDFYAYFTFQTVFCIYMYCDRCITYLETVFAKFLPLKCKKGPYLKQKTWFLDSYGFSPFPLKKSQNFKISSVFMQMRRDCQKANLSKNIIKSRLLYTHFAFQSHSNANPLKWAKEWRIWVERGLVIVTFVPIQEFLKKSKIFQEKVHRIHPNYSILVANSM